MSEGTVDGHPRQIWWNADGKTVVVSYTITNMAHGTPLGIAENEERYGMPGVFLIEAGISSSYHIANFFGLTDPPQRKRRRTIDVGAVIARALAALGFEK
jgi:poly(3-hydroxybutyrate) depolymerase